MTRKERRNLSIEQKRAALAYAARGVSQQELAEEFGVAQSTISRYIKFGGMLILAECGITEQDSRDAVREKARTAGYRDSNDILKIYDHYLLGVN